MFSCSDTDVPEYNSGGMKGQVSPVHCVVIEAHRILAITQDLNQSSRIHSLGLDVEHRHKLGRYDISRYQLISLDDMIYQGISYISLDDMIYQGISL